MRVVKGLGMGVTKAPIVYFSVSKIFDLVKVPVRFFESHSFFIFFYFNKTYLTRMTHQPGAVLHEILPYTTQLIKRVIILQHET